MIFYLVVFIAIVTIILGLIWYYADRGKREQKYLRLAMFYMYYPFEGVHQKTQDFGVNAAAYKKFGLAGHNGIDWAMPTGTPIYAVRSGKVTVVAYDAAGYGWYIEIEHDYGKTIYAHLTEKFVKVGDLVAAKQLIATSGGGLNDPERGNSNGPHLHLGLKPLPSLPGYNYDNGFKGAIDPAPFLADWTVIIPESVTLYRVRVTADVLNVRSSPDASNSRNIIGKMKFGEEADVIDSANRWVQIKWLNAWIHGDWTAKIDTPAPDEELVQGGDVSFYNGPINFTKWKDELPFVIIRIGQENFIDTKYRDHWIAAEGNVQRLRYFFFDWRPGADSPEMQGAFARSICNNEDDNVLIAMDFEDPYPDFSTSPLPDRNTRFDMMRRWRDGAKLDRPGLYSNMSFLKEILPYPDWLINEWWLWVAQWMYKVGTTSSLMTWYTDIKGRRPETYGWQPLFWQFTCKLPGKSYGIPQAADLDGNVWFGTYDQLVKFIGNTVNLKKLTLEEKVQILWANRCEYCGVVYTGNLCPNCGNPR